VLSGCWGAEVPSVLAAGVQNPQKTPGFGKRCPVSAKGARFRQKVPGFGQKVPGFGQKVPGFGHSQQELKKVPGFGQKVPGFGQKVPGFNFSLWRWLDDKFWRGKHRKKRTTQNSTKCEFMPLSLENTELSCGKDTENHTAFGGE
jgi:hypothetical protein